MKERTLFDKILSVFLAIALLVGCVTNWNMMGSVQAEDNGEYAELTFSNFGLDDGAYTSKCWKQNTELTTLDGVAITGDVIFTETAGDGFNTGFRLSPIGSNNADWNNFQIFHRDNASGNFIGVRYVGYGAFALNFTADELGVTDLSTARIRIRMCFDKVSDTSLNVSVTMTVGERSATHAGTIEGFAAMVSNSTGYQIGVAEQATGISFYSVQREYTELTFNSFGLDDGAYTSKCWKQSTELTSLNGVAITGDVIFTKTAGDGFNTGFRLSPIGSNNADWNNFQIFHRDNASGDFIGVRYVGYGAFAINFTPDELGVTDLSTGRIRIRMCFDKVSDTSLNVAVTMTVGEKSVTHAGTIEGFAAMVSNSTGYQIGVAEQATGISFYSVDLGQEEPEEPEYTELTFNSFGLDDGAYTSKCWKQNTALTTLDGVAITGDVIFTETAGDGFNTGFRLSPIGSNNADWNNFQIFHRDNASGNFIGVRYVGYGAFALNFTADELEVTDLSTARIRIRMCFDKVSDTSLNVAVTMTVGEKSVTYEGRIDDIPAMITNDAGYQIGAAEQVTGISFYSIGGGTVEPEYTEYTFCDFGLDDGLYTSACWGQNTALITLDGVAITGDVIFTQTAGDGFNTGFRLSPIGSNNADWNNFQIFHRDNASGNFIGVRYVGYGAFALNFTPDELGVTDLSTATIRIRMCFDKVSDTSLNVVVTMTVGEKSVTHEGTIDGIPAMISNDAGYQIGAAGSATGVSFYSIGGGTIKPNQPVIPDAPVVLDKPQKELSEYELITFSSFGIDDAVIQERTANCRGLVSDLNGKVFTGKITFPSDSTSEMDGILTIGGSVANRWYGLRVGVNKDGNLYVNEAVNGSQRWDISSEKAGIIGGIRGKEIELSMTFTVVDKNNVYVGIYINNAFCGEKLYQNLTKDFGSTLMVYSAKSAITIASADTPWTKFLNSEVNLEYFGFSNANWKKELAAICK